MNSAIRRISAVLFLILTAAPLWSQQSSIRDHFMLRVGAAYDQGDFGTTETSRVLFVPVTLRYLGQRFDLSATPALARVSTTAGIRLIEGQPTPIGQRPDTTPETQSGIGDTVLRARLYLLDDRGPDSPAPALTPFFKVKLPTAQEDLNLGTGRTDYGFGVEWDKQLVPVFLFGDISYTVIGKFQGLDLRNRPGASFGIGRRISESVTASGLVDWRRSIIKGNPDWAELSGLLSFRISPTVSINPYAFVGLTRGTSDFGLGTELAFRFGRY